MSQCEENAAKSKQQAKQSTSLDVMWANMSNLPQPSDSKRPGSILQLSPEITDIEDDFTGADALLSSCDK